MKDKLAKTVGLSSISPEDLQHKKHGPEIIEGYKELMIEESQTDDYYLFIKGYTQSLLRDFESYLRILTDINEEYFQIKTKQYISKSIRYKVIPGICTFEDLSELLSRGFKKEFEIGGKIQPNIKNDEPDSIIIECESNALRTELVVRHEIIALKFDEKPFFITILGISPYWDYKSYNEYSGEKV